jgi:hypothetical protein
MFLKLQREREKLQASKNYAIYRKTMRKFDVAAPFWGVLWCVGVPKVVSGPGGWVLIEGKM